MPPRDIFEERRSSRETFQGRTNRILVRTKERHNSIKMEDIMNKIELV